MAGYALLVGPDGSGKTTITDGTAGVREVARKVMGWRPLARRAGRRALLSLSDLVWIAVASAIRPTVR
jgi:hypothetical protein